MRVNTVEEASALVGTVWERDGKRREVTRVENVFYGPRHRLVYGNVYWRRPGGKERKFPQWLPHFTHWLAKAVKVET